MKHQCEHCSEPVGDNQVFVLQMYKIIVCKECFDYFCKHHKLPIVGKLISMTEEDKRNKLRFYDQLIPCEHDVGVVKRTCLDCRDSLSECGSHTDIHIWAKEHKCRIGLKK